MNKKITKKCETVYDFSFLVLCQITLVGKDQVKTEAGKNYVTVRQLFTSYYLKLECYNTGLTLGMCFRMDIGGKGSNFVVTITLTNPDVRIHHYKSDEFTQFKFADMGLKPANQNEWSSVVVYVAR